MSLYDAFDALMRDLGKLGGGLQPTASERRKREECARAHVARVQTDAALGDWVGFLQAMIEEVGAGGDTALLQKALALADEHPITRAAERWLGEVGFDKPYFRLLNRPAGAGPRQPRVTFAKYANQAVAVAADGSTVATADGNRVAIYDPVTGALRKTFKTKHSEEIRRLAIHPDGRRVFTGRVRDDWNVRMYDMETGKQLRSFGGKGDTQDFVLLPDGEHLLGADESLRSWAIEGTGKKAAWVAAEGEGYFSPALHPNGKELVVRVGVYLQIRSLADGAMVREVPLVFHDLDLLDELLDRAALVLPDGKRGLFAVDDGSPRVEVFDLETGAHLKSLEGHAKPVNALALSPGGERIATAAGDGYVRIWKAGSLECIWAERAHRGDARSVAFLTNDTIVSTGADGVGRVWDIDEGGAPAQATDPTDNVLIMRAMPDGEHVLALHDDGVLREWEIATGTCSRRFDASKIPNDGDLRLWIAPDARVALLTRDRFMGDFESIKPPKQACVFRFDLVSGESGLFYTSDKNTITGPAAIIDGAFYVAPEDGLIRFALSPSGNLEAEKAERLLDDRVSSYDIVRNRWLLSCTNELSVIDTKKPAAGETRIARTDYPFMFVTRSEFADDQRTLLAVASNDTRTIVIALPEMKILHRFGTSVSPASIVRPPGVAFSTDGQTIYSGGPTPELFIWDVATGTSQSWPLPDTPIHGIYAHPSLGHRLVVQTASSVMLLDPKERTIQMRWGYSLASSLNDRIVVLDRGAMAMWIDQQLLFLTGSARA